MRVQSLGREDPLEEGMATHSNILAKKIPWAEEPGGLHGVTKSWTCLKRLSMHAHSVAQYMYRMPSMGASLMTIGGG